MRLLPVRISCNGLKKTFVLSAAETQARRTVQVSQNVRKKDEWCSVCISFYVRNHTYAYTVILNQK